MSAAADNRFTIHMVAADPANFDPGADASFVVVNGNGTLTDDWEDRITLNLDGFSAGTQPEDWYLTEDSGDLVLRYKAPITTVIEGVPSDAANPYPVLVWNATVGQEYDLIKADYTSYDEHALRSRWELVKTVTATGTVQSAVDDADDGPWNLSSGTMRFYRLANHDRWQASQQNRLSAEEVYIAQPMYLYPGQNWVQLPGVPESIKLKDVLGTYLPDNLVVTVGTKITLYNRDATASSSKSAGLTTSGWVYTSGGSDSADDMLLPLNDAFVIEIPTNSTTQKIRFFGRVPTNDLSQTIVANGAYNLVAFRLPRPMHPGQLGLVGDGFTGSSSWPYSDWMWTFNRSRQQVPDIMYYNTTLGEWRFLNKNQVIPANYIKPDDGLVIHTRASTTNFTWTLPLPYPPPGPEM